MKLRYLLSWILLLMVIEGHAQCDGAISTASDHDNYFGWNDTMCAGTCQRYWIRNPECPEFAGADFFWIFYSANKIDTIKGDTVTYCFNDTGNFRMDVYAFSVDWNNAHNIGALNVVVPCLPKVDLVADRETICVNESVNFKQVSDGTVTDWQWTFQGGNPATYTGKQPPPVYYSDTGYFNVSLLATNAYGGLDMLKVNFIHVMAGPVPYQVENEFMVKEGDEVTLSACAEGGDYTWKPAVNIVEDNDTLIIVQPESTQRYMVTITNENGCATNCDYMVYVQNGLLLPTAFTPNGDGVNDVFRILNTNIKLLNFSIYNRWGELVFSTSDINEGWDGVYKDVAQPMSTFVWTCDYVISKTGKRKSAKGNVTLVR